MEKCLEKQGKRAADLQMWSYDKMVLSLEFGQWHCLLCEMSGWRAIKYSNRNRNRECIDVPLLPHVAVQHLTIRVYDFKYTRTRHRCYGLHSLLAVTVGSVNLVKYWRLFDLRCASRFRWFSSVWNNIHSCLHTKEIIYWRRRHWSFESHWLLSKNYDMNARQFDNHIRRSVVQMDHSHLCALQW